MPHKKFLQQKKHLKTLRHHLKPIWLQFLQISTKITLALVFLEWSCRNRISNCSGANVQLYTCVLLQNLLHIPFYSGEKIDFQWWWPFWTRACLRRCEQNFINWGNKLKAMALVASRGRLEHIRGGKHSQEALCRDRGKISFRIWTEANMINSDSRLSLGLRKQMNKVPVWNIRNSLLDKPRNPSTLLKTQESMRIIRIFEKSKEIFQSLIPCHIYISRACGEGWLLRGKFPS